MRLLDKKSKDVVKFIPVFNDGSGVHARPLSETERDAAKTAPMSLQDFKRKAILLPALQIVE